MVNMVETLTIFYWGSPSEITHFLEDFHPPGAFQETGVITLELLDGCEFSENMQLLSFFLGFA